MTVQPRRTFLKQNLALGTSALLTANAKAAETIIKVGFIGPGGMGTNHLRLLVQRKDVSIDY
ncbi:MAG: hypothetical protein RLZ61_1104, partial [Planctomycetota bacterium]